MKNGKKAENGNWESRNSVRRVGAPARFISAFQFLIL
jgi:hypothetical protein